MDRKARFSYFLDELRNGEASSSGEAARERLASTLILVEDLFSGAPYCPENWMFDGRMYPPDDDYERESPDPNVRIFRTRGHYVHFAINGAIKIVVVRSGTVVLDIPGSDGLKSPY